MRKWQEEDWLARTPQLLKVDNGTQWRRARQLSFTAQQTAGALYGRAGSSATKSNRTRWAQMRPM